MCHSAEHLHLLHTPPSLLLPFVPLQHHLLRDNPQQTTIDVKRNFVNRMLNQMIKMHKKVCLSFFFSFKFIITIYPSTFCTWFIHRYSQGAIYFCVNLCLWSRSTIKLIAPSPTYLYIHPTRAGKPPHPWWWCFQQTHQAPLTSVCSMEKFKRHLPWTQITVSLESVILNLKLRSCAFTFFWVLANDFQARLYIY